MSSTSSRTIWADLPPSSRKTRLMVGGAGLHDPPADRGRAGEADHVDVGAGGEHLADRLVRGGHDVEDAGGDVGVLGRQPAEGQRRSTGVSGAGLSTTVQPAASAGATLAMLIWFG